jgi:hypothetical protein
MTLQNPKDVRSALKTAIETDLTDLQTVYGYMPKDFNGQSPVCTIERLPIQLNLKTSVGFQAYDFAVSFYARSDGDAASGLTAADAEDVLDDLLYALCTSVLARYNGEFIQASDPVQMTMESGAVYQSEIHYVRISRP